MRSSRFSVIVPAHNAADTLADCLRAIFISSAHLDEVIVFNDGSTDDTLKIAQGFPVQVLTNRGLPVGPALGRNRCAAIAKSKILVFVDADVIVHRGAIETLVSTIVEDLTVAAAFGSYDDRPRSRQIAALYANLRHHYMHQNGQTDALTFWAGLGAIRQSAFQDVGRFDSRIGCSSIEDIELGIRLNAAGYQIRLVPTAQGTHCKDWRLLELWRTDIFRRAIPWSRLLVNGPTQGMSLNLSRTERLKVILTYSTLLAGGVGIVYGFELAWTRCDFHLRLVQCILSRVVVPGGRNEGFNGRSNAPFLLLHLLIGQFCGDRYTQRVSLANASFDGQKGWECGETNCSEVCC